MNPVLIILIVLGAIVVWFCGAFIFFPLGKVLYKFWKDAMDEIHKEDPNEKEETKNAP